jgi:hypothetical protein
MCQLAACPQCKRPTYAGCGKHIEQVLGHVPKADRCRCRETVQTQAHAAPRATKAWWPFS